MPGWADTNWKGLTTHCARSERYKKKRSGRSCQPRISCCCQSGSSLPRHAHADQVPASVTYTENSTHFPSTGSRLSALFSDLWVPFSGGTNEPSAYSCPSFRLSVTRRLLCVNSFPRFRKVPDELLRLITYCAYAIFHSLRLRWRFLSYRDRPPPKIWMGEERETMPSCQTYRGKMVCFFSMFVFTFSAYLSLAYSLVPVDCLSELVLSPRPRKNRDLIVSSNGPSRPIPFLCNAKQRLTRERGGGTSPAQKNLPACMPSCRTAPASWVCSRVRCVLCIMCYEHQRKAAQPHLACYLQRDDDDEWKREGTLRKNQGNAPSPPTTCGVRS